MGRSYRGVACWLSSAILLAFLVALAFVIGGDSGDTNPVATRAPAGRGSATPERFTGSLADRTASADGEAGRRLYDIYCWFCHGAQGRGDGPLADFLTVPPRDFTRAEYKVRSTTHHAVPTDEDLYLTITRGIPETLMPEWSALSQRARRQLVAYIKTFSDRFRTAASPPVMTGQDPFRDVAEAVQRGRQVFEQSKCWLCHGRDGRGDGPVTTALVRQWGLPYPARNLRHGAGYKGGSTVQDIVRTLTTGFSGTPMGPYDHLLTPGERWSVAHYVASLAEGKISLKTPVEPGVSWQRGRWVFFGRGRCILCHRVEGIGASRRGPDLSAIGAVAATRKQGGSAVEYIFESITSPEAYLVPEYGQHMPGINREGIFLEPDEIRSLVVYLAAQGEGAVVDRAGLASLPEPPGAHAAEVLPQLGGDPRKGFDVYNGETASCFKCHLMHGHGATTGPDITNLSAFQSHRQVVESLVEPNKVIVHGYHEVGVVTVDGDVLAGVMVYEDSGEVHLLDNQGQVRHVPRDEIDEIVPREVSNMPTGIVEQLDQQDYADLVALLLDQRPALDGTVRPSRTFPFVNPLRRAKNGPPLGNVVHKVGRAWLAGWLEDPRDHDPNTFMPNLELADGEVRAIIAYLATVAGADLPRYQWEPFLTRPQDDLSDEQVDALYEETAQGKAIWQQSRCGLCHTVRNVGGVLGHAPALTNAAAKLRRDWLGQWLDDPKYYFPHTQMPRFRFSGEQRKSLLAYLLRGSEFGGLDVEVLPDDQTAWEQPDVELARRGREVIERSRCIVCHDIPGIRETLGSGPAWPEPSNDFESLVRDARCLTCHAIGGQGGTFAPDLTTVGSRLRKEWIEQFLVAPDVVRPLSQQMPKLQLTPEEAHAAAEYAKKNLTDSRMDPQYPGGPRTLADTPHGKALYDAKGCAACHQIGQEGGAVGPELTKVADRLEPAYVYHYIKNPQRFFPDAVEPNYGFTNREVSQISEYLLSLERREQGER